MKPEVSVNHIAIPMTVSTKFVQNRDYDELENKPQINGVTLQGDLTSEDLGIIIPTKVSDLDNDTGFITGDVIDDTAGESDTDKTWSADKLNTQFSNVLRRTNATGSTSMQNHEGGVYEVGISSNLLKVSVPWTKVEPIAGSGIGVVTYLPMGMNTQAVHQLYNTGVYDIDPSTEPGLLKYFKAGTPEYSIHGYVVPMMPYTKKLFDVATTAETQAIITEWEASNA